MRTWASAPVVLLVAVALIVATGACLVHPDDGAPDLCLSLLAVTLGLTVVCSLGRTQRVVLARMDGYRPFSFDPPAPPPKA
jgi:hypothetical protein